MALYPDSLYDFPNVSAYDSDLREVLAMLRGVTHKMRDFEVVNKITNAGAWDITKQYKPWTIVSDNNIGYISVRPVPAGIEITNTDYWALVADYDILITNLSERIALLENYVTPEMFGAKGDGIHDDTREVQHAINSNKPVLLINKYLISESLQIGGSEYIFGRGYDSQLISNIDDGSPIIECAEINAHIQIHDFTIIGSHKNAVGIKILNAYDNCEISNIFFLSMANTAIMCGGDAVSQGLLINNCFAWYSESNPDAGSAHIFEFLKCNEFNITNSKLLYNGANRGSTENLLATNCVDMNISGCSFGSTTKAAVKFTGAQSRYGRLIGNTYELIDGGDHSAIIELIGTVADGVQNFIIIEQPYYNCPSRVYNENSAQNIIIGLSTAGGRRNLSINNKGGADAYANLNLKSDGNELLSDAFGIQSGDTIKHTIKENTNSDLTFINHTTGNIITFGVHIELSRNGGGLKLKDANGRAYYVIVNTNGQLQVVPA